MNMISNVKAFAVKTIFSQHNPQIDPSNLQVQYRMFRSVLNMQSCSTTKNIGSPKEVLAPALGTRIYPSCSS